MNLWPYALYTGTTAEKRRSSIRDWKARKLAEDPNVCRHCYSRPAGFGRGSKVLCEICRRDRLERYHSRYSPATLLRLAALASKPKRITADDLGQPRRRA